MERFYEESYSNIKKENDVNYIKSDYYKSDRYDYDFDSNYGLNKNPDFDFFSINAVQLA